VQKYVTEDFIAACVAEWGRSEFEVTIDPEDIKGMRRIDDLEDYIKAQARTDIETSLTQTLAEFMGEDPEDSSQWDLDGLSRWVMSHYHVSVSKTQLKKMDVHEVEEFLKEAALEQISKRNCSGLLRYLEPHYHLNELGAWAEAKFGIVVKPEEMLADVARGEAKPAPELVSLIEKRARDAYQLRELEYPVDTVLMFTFGQDAVSTDNPYAAEYVRNWAWMKYRVELTLEHIRSQSIRKLRDELIGYQEAYMEDGKVEGEIADLMKANPEREALIKAANARFMMGLDPEDFEPKPPRGIDGRPLPGAEPAPVDVRALLIQRAKQFLRRELTELEQFVLIQIFDQSWKDHLYAMDMLKNGIGLQAFAERDPRIAYKQEGYRYFQEMMAGVRDKVTDLIFRARVVGQAQTRNAYQVTAATHDTSTGYGVGENVAAAGGAPSDTAQAAAQTQGEGAAKVKTIVRTVPKVGRNDPCPCGSGKKYKKCHGANEA
jgi:preprotein translocase subunit SecA